MDPVSGSFLLFTAAVVLIYYALPRRARPPWLLIASLFFYLCSDLRYLFFLLFSAATTFLTGRALPASKRKKGLLALTLTLNLGLMAVLKLLPYSWDLAGRLLGLEHRTLHLIYPLGISFYTLSAASYVIDVYRGKLAPERRFWRYGLFLCYFPIIIQGPISRYGQLAPQLAEPHALSYKNLCFGAQLMLWGFFKKLVIADRAALLVDLVYASPGEYGGLAVPLAAALYVFQIYADFSGCVDILRGVSGMLGVELIENFRRPFFSTSIAELWRRWHISLGAWLRDYLYIPLGGSRKGRRRRNLNLLIVFFVSGLWHGAGVNFFFWGMLNGLYQVVGERTLPARDRFWQSLGRKEAPRKLRQLGCFAFFTFAAHFFRAPGLPAALRMLSASLRGLSPDLLQLGLDGADFAVLGLSLLFLLLVSFWQERLGGTPVRERLAALPLPLRWGVWLLGLLAVLVFGIYGPGYSSSQFIYMGF
ncbi:MAG: hypothetical protein K6F56_02815 [Oscillospiraceae bacterium]|nr:hypothetical protein [Oscillospiraceae bacterium]